MDNVITSSLTSRTWLCTCVCVLALMTLGAGAEESFEGAAMSDQAQTDFSKLWEFYILPRLEMDIYNKLSKLKEETLNQEQPQTVTDITMPKSRLKRVGIAGLENLDLLTNTLDQQNKMRSNRFKMMSVNRSLSDLRQLMMQNGRRK